MRTFFQKTGIKRAIALCVFLFLVCQTVLHLTYLFRNTGWSRYNLSGFYSEPQNSLDVVFIGGSNVFRYWNPVLAYEEAGFTSYNYAVEFGTPLLIEAVEDIRRYQEPRLFVVDPRHFLSRYWENASTIGYYNQLDSQDITPERLRAVAYYRTVSTSGRGAVSSLFDLIYYHSHLSALSSQEHWMFSDDNRNDISMSSYGSAKGFILFSPTFQQNPFSNDFGKMLVNDAEALLPGSEKALRDFFTYCQKHNVPVLFAESPFVFTEQDIKESNAIAGIAAEYGIPFINTNFYTNEMGLDYTIDFYDGSHVNLLGAEKYTAYLTAYLEENYVLPDHRDDSRFYPWRDAVSEYSLSTGEPRSQLLDQVLSEI